ncbi:hypothetical protein DNK49_22895 [Azoarcus communis]|uniref:Uncharacterized protein n=1 Tax=Parazoarcus communis SWub3 = DSM 12120 TaxID=1121029 RepID=A0A323UPC4_9RHOO|nr:hypothetical protein DNK49_22895 [Azoarcus communis] [Parazoarcus communis SWub3 = DSM 12120]
MAGDGGLGELVFGVPAQLGEFVGALAPAGDIAVGIVVDDAPGGVVSKGVGAAQLIDAGHLVAGRVPAVVAFEHRSASAIVVTITGISTSCAAPSRAHASSRR